MSVTVDTYAPPHGRPGTEVEIDLALGEGLHLLALLEPFAGPLSFPELGAIDLPPVIGSNGDQSRLRVVAPLYLASELESARLLPSVETLAGLFASGGLGDRAASAATLLYDFWNKRRERFSRQEREAFFARLFGTSSGTALADSPGPNDAFEPLLTKLALALREAGTLAAIGDLGGLSGQAWVRTAARDLAANLIPRASGLVLFAARDIMHTITAAVEILKQESVQRAVAARSVWGAVEKISQRYMSEPAATHRHVTRGRSGMTILAWLAEVVPALSRPEAALIERDSVAIAAADAWLSASDVRREPAAGLLRGGA